MDLCRQASVQLEIGNVGGALDLLQRALAQDPENATAHALRALGLLRRDDKAQAIVYLARGRYQDAEQRFGHLLEIEPEDAANYRAPARSKIIHATAWGLLLYGLVGEQLFDSAVAREIRGFRLRRDF